MHLGRKCEPGVSWVVPIQQMYLAPQVEGQRPTGLSKGGDPAQQCTLLHPSAMTPQRALGC